MINNILAKNHTYIHYPVIDSTNAQAKRLISLSPDTILRTPYNWVVADEQSKGRGRQNRLWQSPKGNVYTSCFFKIDVQKYSLTHICFASGLALSKTIQHIAQQNKDADFTKYIQLKWPNDIMLYQKKCAGILLEVYRGYVIIGLGVNISSSPSASASTHLQMYVSHVTKDVFVNQLAFSLEHYMNKLVSNGFTPLRSEWLSKAYQLGKEIKFMSDDVSYTGIFEEIDCHGALVLNMAGKRKTFFSGDLFVL